MQEERRQKGRVETLMFMVLWCPTLLKWLSQISRAPFPPSLTTPFYSLTYPSFLGGPARYNIPFLGPLLLTHVRPEGLTDCLSNICLCDLVSVLIQRLVVDTILHVHIYPP